MLKRTTFTGLLQVPLIAPSHRSDLSHCVRQLKFPVAVRSAKALAATLTS